MLSFLVDRIFKTAEAARAEQLSRLEVMKSVSSSISTVRLLSLSISLNRAPNSSNDKSTLRFLNTYPSCAILSTLLLLTSTLMNSLRRSSMISSAVIISFFNLSSIIILNSSNYSFLSPLLSYFLMNCSISDY